MNSATHDGGTAGVQPQSEDVPATPEEERATEDVMRLLSEHVPLTLLADLAQPAGPDSPEILEDEGLPEVAWWSSDAQTDDGEAPGPDEA
jgi:hypothetical protein